MFDSESKVGRENNSLSIGRKGIYVGFQGKVNFLIVIYGIKQQGCVIFSGGGICVMIGVGLIL